jgi:hypothetical protein
VGYEAIARARYERQLKLGIIDADTHPRSESMHRSWDELSAEEQADEARVMAVYGAMIDSIDQNLGRLFTHLIQWFGGSLNLNIHFHMLFLDGVYADNKHGTVVFHQLKKTNNDELTQLTYTIAHRVGRYLERRGLLVRDTGQSYLTSEAVDADDETPMNHLLGSSITYRIAVGPQQGRMFLLSLTATCQL